MANLTYTYTQLAEALQAWPEDSDAAYVAQIPSIINLGEIRLVRDLNLELFDVRDTSKTVTAAATRAARIVAKPTGCIVLRGVALALNGVIVATLELRSRAYCDMYAPDPAVQALPRYYCEESATEIQLVPTPLANYTVVQTMVKRPADGLSSGTPSGTSWLSTTVPDALFAACLMEAEHLLKADDRYADFRTKYYQELLPNARTELRNSIRRGDHTPPLALAQPVG